MYISLDDLITYRKNKIPIDSNIEFDVSLLKNSIIKKLQNIKFVGNITMQCDDSFKLEGSLSGIMILMDDLNLEDVEYKFETVVDEVLENSKDEINNIITNDNKINLTDILLSLILVEVPSKITNNKITKKEGNGWRLITEEEEINNSNNSPFSDLDKILKGKES